MIQIQNSLIILLLICHPIHAQVSVEYPQTLPGSDLGISRINQALIETGYEILQNADQAEVAKQIQVRVDPGNQALEAEGFEIERRKTSVLVTGKDPAGAMYGALTLAEEIQIKKDLNGIANQLVNPTFQVRGIKFNLPWEPYRESKSMDYHLSTCRDLKFWDAFLEMMADNRFNLLALYNMHPFPYMVKLDQFPEACPFTDQEMEDWKAFWKGKSLSVILSKTLEKRAALSARTARYYWQRLSVIRLLRFRCAAPS